MGWICGILQELLKYKKKEIKVELLKTPDQLNNVDYKIIGVVRNPRDRMLSVAFWERYRDDPQILEISNASYDMKGIEATVYSNTVQDANNYQFTIMEVGKSTWNSKIPKNYIWTCYHWLFNDTHREIKKIIEFLELDIPDSNIEYSCYLNSFKYLTGRNSLIEDRTESLRNGCEHSYKQWFFYRVDVGITRLFQDTLQEYINYWNIIEHEGQLYNQIDFSM